MPPLKMLRDKQNQVFQALRGDMGAAYSSTFLNGDPKHLPPTFQTDIPRTLFFPTNQHTRGQFESAWSADRSHPYNQGDLDGSLYVTLFNAHLEKIHAADSMNQKKEDDLKRKNHVKIPFAYYDDEGNLCALTIQYCKTDPKIWVATIYKNLTAPPEVKEVLVIAPAALISKKPEKKQAGGSAVVTEMDRNKAADEFNAFLKSKQVSEIFSGIILNNGELDIKRLNSLNMCINTVKSFGETNLLDAICIYQSLLTEQNKEIEQFKKNYTLFSSTLEEATGKSFFKRNWKRMLFSALFIGLLILTMAFPPGAAFIGLSYTVAVIVSAAIAVTATVVAVTKSAWVEYKLPDYEKRIHEFENKFEQNCGQALQEYTELRKEKGSAVHLNGLCQPSLATDSSGVMSESPNEPTSDLSTSPPAPAAQPRKQSMGERTEAEHLQGGEQINPPLEFYIIGSP